MDINSSLCHTRNRNTDKHWNIQIYVKLQKMLLLKLQFLT